MDSFKEPINVAIDEEESNCLIVKLNFHKGTHAMLINGNWQSVPIRKSEAKMCYKVDNLDNLKITDSSVAYLKNGMTVNVKLESNAKYLKFYDIEYYNKLDKELPALYNKAISKY